MPISEERLDGLRIVLLIVVGSLLSVMNPCDKSHGEIEISNNQVENAIRLFVIGRKGWLFADTPQGAEASAIIYSLMETAKANNLRLDDYLLHLLSILPERAEQSKDFEIEDLLPWSEEMKSWFSAV